MPTLNWIGKDKVVNHHLDVPYRVLNHQYGFTASEGQTSNVTESGNKIIHGDNLEALKSLLPEHEDSIKCIYIDPPYNTGNQTWVYNDNVNDPKIRKWLGEIVGKEGEDLSRHDKWLCMMYPRLKLLHKLLANDGAIFISIDDNELANLKLICDEIFGYGNFVSTVIWQKSKKGDAKLIASTHEYVVIYAKNKSELIKAGIWRQKKEGADDVLAYYQELKIRYSDDHQKISKEIATWFRGLAKGDPRKAHKHYKFSDARGLYFAADFAGPDDGRESRPRYDIIHPVTGLPVKKPSTGWRWEESRTEEALKIVPPRIHFGPDEQTIPCRKSYLFEIATQPFSSVFYADGRGATKIVDQILGKKSFEFPKTPFVLEDFFQLFVKEDDLVLDSFAGSGTTAHAVLNLNKKHGGNRRFILIELETYANTKTAERTKRVIKGYGTGKSIVKGTGGEFDFYTLGDPLFDGYGNLNESVGLEQIREYVWYSETRSKYKNSDLQDFLLGIKNECAYYFYYDPNKITELDFSFLSLIDVKADQYVIYADNCLLTEEFMQAKNIIFKKIPRDITRF